MSTTIRPELSRKNRYFVEKHRYYELKHFCLQYPAWKRSRAMLDGRIGSAQEVRVNRGSPSNPTEECVEARDYYTTRIEMVEQAARDTDGLIGHYILKAVTEGLSYEKLRVRYLIPCCKDSYYDLYRKFFWLLSGTRK